MLSPWSSKEAFSFDDKHILFPSYPCRINVNDQPFDNIFEYLFTLEHVTVSEREEVVIACIRERRLHDHYFDQALEALKEFAFVFVHYHPFWGCGQTQEQYDTSEYFPGAMWIWKCGKLVWNLGIPSL